MKKNLALTIAITGWFAIITQYVIMLGNRTLSIGETTARFFIFFTILVNLLVALYFTRLVIFDNDPSNSVHKPGRLTALALYIFVVGFVYQVALRHLWSPKGMQLIVDELLHSVIPVFTIIFWILYENKTRLSYAQIPGWTIFPLLYLGLILVYGNATGYYPYPFIDVTTIGIKQALINAVIILLSFLAIATLVVFIGKKLLNQQRASGNR